MDQYFLQLVTITGLVSFIFLYIITTQFRTKTSENHKKFREAPEPSGAWPIIGHLPLLRSSHHLLHETLGALADKHGPAFKIRVGVHRTFVVSSKEIAKECFTTNDRALLSRPTTAATKHMCYYNAVFGFAPHGPYWLHMRKLVTSELLSNRRRNLFGNIQDSGVETGIRKLYNLWVENNCLSVAVELNRWFQDISVNLIVRVMGGKRDMDVPGCEDSEARRCQKAIAEFFRLMGVFVVSDAFPFLWWLDNLQEHVGEMKKTAKELDAIFAGWLEEHKKTSGRLKADHEGDDEKDLIDLMLSLKEEGHLSGLPYHADTIIKSTCLSIVSGAIDATESTLTWAISLLLNNRIALKKAQEEIDLRIGFERQVSKSDIKNLNYLQAIIKETLRLYPVAPLSGAREAFEDCTIAGYEVPAGTRLMINVWKIHSDPKIWSNPLGFEPERFLTSHMDVDVTGQNFEILPFSAGRRSCPGTSFALQVLHLTLGRLLHGFHLATPMDESVDMSAAPGLNLHKATPLKVLVSPRLPANIYGC